MSLECQVKKSGLYTMKNSMEILQKLGIKLPYDPTIPLLGIYPKKIIIEKDTCIPVFTASLFTMARTWKQPRCPSTYEWISCGTYILWNIPQP